MKNIEESLKPAEFLEHFGHIQKITRAEMKLACLRGELYRKLNPINLSVLPRGLLERYKVAKKKLAEVERMKFNNFISSKGINKNIVKDIVPFERVAAVYEKYVQEKHVKSLKKKEEIYGVLIACSSWQLKEPIFPFHPILSPKDFGYHNLTKKEIIEIQKRYKDAARKKIN
ncbi:MAG: hypothetical protein GX453_10000 [Lactococcus chungangensis]|uniref:Uncharacterized protein n=1 Tax=Pseudolactococcus chungangensis TaxID=451457 RepID=A0A847J757_9LACT|nr:hypothetical protein [Lactococcus chungangensis]